MGAEPWQLVSFEELFLRLEAEEERRRKDAIYVGAAFSGEEELLSPRSPTNGRQQASRDRYESLKERNSDFWSN